MHNNLLKMQKHGLKLCTNCVQAVGLARATRGQVHGLIPGPARHASMLGKSALVFPALYTDFRDFSTQQISLFSSVLLQLSTLYTGLIRITTNYIKLKTYY